MKRHSCSIILCSYGKEYEESSEWGGEGKPFLEKDLNYEPYCWYLVCLNYNFSYDHGLLEGGVCITSLLQRYRAGILVPLALTSLCEYLINEWEVSKLWILMYK